MRPSGVLITRSQRPRRIRSTTVGSPSVASLSFRTGSTAIPAAASVAAVPSVAYELEAEADERGRDRHRLLVVGLADGDEDGARARQPPSGRPLGLVERGREVGGARHHLAGRAHLRSEDRIAAREAREGQHRGLDAPLARRTLGRQLELRDRRAEREAAGRLDELDVRSPCSRRARSATRAGSPRSRTRRRRP